MFEWAFSFTNDVVVGSFVYSSYCLISCSYFIGQSVVNVRFSNWLWRTEVKGIKLKFSLCFLTTLLAIVTQTLCSLDVCISLWTIKCVCNKKKWAGDKKTTTTKTSQSMWIKRISFAETRTINVCVSRFLSCNCCHARGLL